MGPLGVPELIIIFVVALVVFGPRKLPELGRSLGKSLSEFKRASNELRSTLDEEIQNEDRRAALAKAPATPTESQSTASDPYEAPEDAYNTPPNDDLPQDDYRVGASDAEATGEAGESAAASAEPSAHEPETVARGQHG